MLHCKSNKNGIRIPKRKYNHLRLNQASERGIDMRMISNNQLWLDKAILLNKTNRPIGVISLRKNNQAKDSGRDSCRTRIEGIVTIMNESGYEPIILLDRDNNVEEYKQCNARIITEASFSLKLRSAIYEVADINYLTNAGPVVCAQLNKKTNYILDSVAASNKFNEEWLLRMGYQKNYNVFAGDSNHQKLYWEELNYAKLKEEILKIKTYNEKSI